MKFFRLEMLDKIRTCQDQYNR